MRLIFVLTSIFILTACTSSVPEGKSEYPPKDTTPVASIPASTTTSLHTYFDNATVETVLMLKDAFDTVLRQGYGQRQLPYIYEQHALRMKLDFLNNEPFQNVVPYDGSFRLNAFPNQTSQLPFLSSKCGFQVGDSGEVFNYLCLGLEENYFSYLTSLGSTCSLIGDFRVDYEQHKSFTPKVRKDMLLRSSEELQFDKLDHQIFYFLFHTLVNEEYWATKTIKE